jgi:PII-like signaling protein
MHKYEPSRMLRLLFTEADKYRGKPLYEAIVEKCRDLHIAGATVFRGIEGFGNTGEIHHSHLVGHDLPILVTIVDTPENLDRLLPAIEEMMDEGTIAASDVMAIRVRKTVRSQGV